MSNNQLMNSITFDFITYFETLPKLIWHSQVQWPEYIVLKEQYLVEIAEPSDVLGYQFDVHWYPYQFAEPRQPLPPKL